MSMPKKPKGGFFDNLFGGVFDFDGDGVESLDEQFIGLQMLNDSSDDSDEDFDMDSGLFPDDPTDFF